MATRVVIGAQWGDEGKGKIIDILAARSDVVVRSQGGNNAGHTVEDAGEVYRLRLIPSGILYPETLNVVGSGTVIDPKGMLEEIDALQKRGIPCDNLRLDPRAHVVMPWHFALDSYSEDALGENKIGTTRNGIGPCYMDKVDRIGIRICDIIHADRFREKIFAVGEYKNKIITKVYDKPPLDLEAVAQEYIPYGQQIAKYVEDISVLVYEAYQQEKTILMEGAQGTLLDVDMGTYPFVTSSNPTAAGACTGAGIGPTLIDDVIGVAKAYTTRVGEGFFPTMMTGELAETLREKGHEFGTVTGRPRRVGWFDSVVLRHSVRVNGITSLVINKLDTLSGFDTLKICTAYEMADGRVTENFPACLEELEGCTPIYEEVPGFAEDISVCTSYDDLPEACKNYINRIEVLCGCPITIIGNGPARSQVLFRG